MENTHIAYIALGSNVGDKLSNLRKTIKILSENPSVEITDASSVYETLPYGNHNQENFYNAVIKIKTSLSPVELFSFIKNTEIKIGRITREQWGPREIDLDIILYDDLILSDDALTLPHKGMHLRDFVLLPLLEMDSDLIHPVKKVSLKEILNQIKERTIISKLDEKLMNKENSFE